MSRPTDISERFTNRQQQIGSFERRFLQSRPVAVLGFYGIGGMGKSFLLQYLFERFCRGDGGADRAIPCASVNFRGNQSTGAPDILWNVREQLQRTVPSLNFRRFVLVWTKHWETTHPGQKMPDNAKLVPEEVEWLSELVDIFADAPFLGSAVKSIEMIFKTTQKARGSVKNRAASDWFARRLETEEGVGWRKALAAMNAADLVELMPAALAADLAEQAGAVARNRGRITLFFDNYETMQSQSSALHGRDAKDVVQSLAKELVDLEAMVVFVVAGRDRLRWAEVRRLNGSWALDRRSIWAQGLEVNDAESFVATHLEQRLVGELSEADAYAYLCSMRGLQSTDIATQIYELVGGYPLGLSTAVDLFTGADGTVDAAETTRDIAALQARLADYEPLSDAWSEEMLGWLLEEILHHLDKTNNERLSDVMQAASIPRWFEEDLLDAMLKETVIQRVFDQLTRYSFVKPFEIDGRQCFRLHRLARQPLRRASRGKQTRELWERRAGEWFDERARAATNAERHRYLVEAIYHGVLLDPVETTLRMDLLFDDYLARYRPDYCAEFLQALIDAQDAAAPDPRIAAWITYFQARLAFANRDWEAARTVAELIPADEACRPQRANALCLLGEYHYSFGDFPASQLAIEQANAIVESLTESDVSPRWKARKQAHLALHLSHTYRRRGHLPEAERYLHDAIALFEQTSYLSQQVHALNNLGSVYLQGNEPERALPFLLRSRVVAEAAGDPHLMLLAQVWYGHAQAQSGDLDGGRTTLAAAIAQGSESFPDLAAWAARLLGDALLTKHLRSPSHADLEAAAGYLGESATRYIEFGSQEGAFASWVLEARALHRLDRGGEIRDLTDLADRLDLRRAARDWMAWWLVVWGHVQLDASCRAPEDSDGRAGAGVECYVEAFELALMESLLLLNDLLDDVAWNLVRLHQRGQTERAAAIVHALASAWHAPREAGPTLAGREFERRAALGRDNRPEQSISERIDDLRQRFDVTSFGLLTDVGTLQ